MEDYRIDQLGPENRIVVSDDHTFGTDAVLLAAFSNIRKKDKAVDLGTGCGIIPLLWCKSGATDVTGVEIQLKACDQFKKSIELNDFAEIAKCVNADLRSLKGVLPFGYYDLVTMNPPYKPVGTGIESVSEADKIARHETMCTISDAVGCAAKLLKFGGKFCLCHRPERLADIICSMRENKIEPKRIRFVSKKADTAPWLVLVEGRLGGKSFLSVEPPLIMYNEENDYTIEVKKMFGDYYTGVM